MFDSSDHTLRDEIPTTGPGAAHRAWSVDPGGDARTVLAEVAGLLEGLVATLESGDVLAPDAVALVDQLTRVERLGGVVRGRMAARVAESPTVWACRGDRSAAHWLARIMGSSVADAVAVLETTNRLPSQPLVADAVCSAALSARQAALVSSTVAAVARHAQPAKPESALTQEMVHDLTARLLDRATTDSVAELSARCAKVRAENLPDAKARHDAVRAARSLRWRGTLDGAVELFGRGTPDEMAEITSAIGAYRRCVFERARREGRHERSDVHDFDALLELVRDHGDGVPAAADSVDDAAACDDSSGDDSSGDDSSGDDSSDPPPPTPAAPRAGGRRRRRGPKVMIRIDEAALHVAADRAQPAAAEVVGHGSIPASRVAALIADQDAEVHMVVTRERVPGSGDVGPDPNADPGFDVVGVAPLGRVRADGSHPALDGEAALRAATAACLVDVTGSHDRRSANAAQATALDYRDPGCCVAGCNQHLRLETDHRTGWAKTHRTGIGDLDRLCAMHHRLKTRLGYRLAPGTGKRPMLPP